MRLRNAKKQQQREEVKLFAKKKVKDLTAAAQNIENALSGKKTRVVDEGDLEKLPPAVAELVDDSPIIFKPNEGPQEEFLSASEQDVLYGGAAGGGKSFAC